MSLHIAAKAGDIAPAVLLPGDPLRAKFIAENFLEDVVCYNEIRGMYGFTGTYQGKRVSVQGTGMGIPSISIYVHELIAEYGVSNLIRIGTCGSLQSEVQLRDVILAMSASTDSAINRQRFHGMNFAPTADFGLLRQAYEAAQQMAISVRVGNVVTSDTFYDDDPQAWKLWADFAVLAVEMETAGLYTLAAKFGVRALSVLSVSDHLPSRESIAPVDRQTTFRHMMQIALAIAQEN